MITEKIPLDPIIFDSFLDTQIEYKLSLFITFNWIYFINKHQNILDRLTRMIHIKLR